MISLRRGYFISKQSSTISSTSSSSTIEVEFPEFRGIEYVSSIHLFSDPDDIDPGTVSKYSIEDNKVIIKVIGTAAPCLLKAEVEAVGW